MRRILIRSLKYYVQHGWPFTRVLISPVLEIFFGTLLSIALPCFLANMLVGQGIGYLSVVFLIAIPGFYLQVRGFWRYLIYFSALNLNAQEVIQGQPPDFEAAYHKISACGQQYGFAMLLYSVPVLLALGLGGIILPFTAVVPPDGVPAVIGISILITLILSVIACIVTLFFSFVFQIYAFEPDLHMTPFQTLVRSTRMVASHFSVTLGLILVTGLATVLIIPALVNMLYELTPLAGFTQALFAPNIHQALLSIPGSESIFAILPFKLEDISREASLGVGESILDSAITSLMLPWGTFCFTLLYQQIHTESGPDEK